MRFQKTAPMVTYLDILPYVNVMPLMILKVKSKLTTVEKSEKCRN